jgi:hypothetical protein
MGTSRLHVRPESGKTGASLTAVDLPPELTTGLIKLVHALVVRSLQRAGAGTGEADPWIPHPRWPCASRRAAVALARSGALPGVRKLGKVFVVRRSALDAYIDAHGLDGKHDQGEDADEFSEAMSRAGLRKGVRAVGRGR